MNSPAAWLFALFYPPRCPYCGRVMRMKDEMCDDCRKQISRNTHTVGIFEEENGKNKVLCAVPFMYKGSVRDAILRFKFYGRREYASAFGISLCKEIGRQFPGVCFDTVTYVPLSAQRLKKRGYNQAALLADAIAARKKIPCETLLHKEKDNFEQHKLSRAERSSNVTGVYTVEKHNRVQGKTVLLCDDIVTTGATLKESAAVLLRNGAAAVYCTAIAVTLLE